MRVRFASPFANLSFSEKVAVFGAIESGAAGPEAIPLAGVLPVFVAFTVYSEAGVFDPGPRSRGRSGGPSRITRGSPTGETNSGATSKTGGT